MYSCVISWWWAMSRPKHVETNFKWNIHLIVASSWCSHLSFSNLVLLHYVSSKRALCKQLPRQNFCALLISRTVALHPSCNPVARFSMKRFPETVFKILVDKGFLVWVGLVFTFLIENLCAEWPWTKLAVQNVFLIFLSPEFTYLYPLEF